MTETEQEHCTRDGVDGRKTIIDEYEGVAESLMRDLEMCKGEQMRLKAELETLRRESKIAADIARESFSHSNAEQCTGNEDYQEAMDNLQKRICIMEKEKETVFQLWQGSLKAVERLEQELKSTQKDDRALRYYEEQVNSVKETYSEAIKALETKLLQTKENFMKHQALWAASRDKTENLSREKNEIEKNLVVMQNEARAKEETSHREIVALRSELEAARGELEKTRAAMLELREKFRRVVASDEESKSKVSEAIELVETAVREKNEAFQREARALEETARLESRLERIGEEYTARFDREIATARDNFAMNSKKYILEIKELKAELRDKATILDRVEREKRLVEDELSKVHHGSENILQRTTANVLELEQKLKEAHLKIETCEESCRRKFEVKLCQADERIAELEARLAASGDRLRRTQLYNGKEFDERIREADDRSKEVLERCSGLERRLARTLDERETLSCELGTLRSSFDREVARRDNERRSQEARIRELQDNLQNANDTLEKANSRGTLLMKQIETLQQELRTKQSTLVNGNEIEESNRVLMLRLKTLQEKFERRTGELSRHVETHQKLCRRWKDEAKSLTGKFQLRSKELRDKITLLQKENEKLNQELGECRQQLAHYRVQVLHRYDQGDVAR